MGLITQKETTPGLQLTGSQALAGTCGSLVLSSKPHWYCLASDLVQLTVQLARSQITSKSVLVLLRDACSLDLQPALLAALREADLH